MRRNYLYKCTDCGTVQAIRDDLGKSTWALYCGGRCGVVTKEHYRLDFKVVGSLGMGCILVCQYEEEDDPKEEQANVGGPVDQ